MFTLDTCSEKTKWNEVRAEWRPCRVASLPPSIVYYVQRSSSLIESLCTSSAKLGRITFQWLHTSYSSTRLPPFLPYLQLAFASTAVHVGALPLRFSLLSSFGSGMPTNAAPHPSCGATPNSVDYVLFLPARKTLG